MKLLNKILKTLPEYNALCNNLRNNLSPTLIVGGSEVHKAHFAMGISKDFKNPLLIITPDETTASRLREDINSMLQSENAALLYPTRDFTFRTGEVASREYEQLRLSVLSHLQNKSCKIVCCCVDALLQHTIPPQELKKRRIKLDIEKPCDLSNLTKALVCAGYEKRDQIEGVAQFSVRGGIIDIFPVNHVAPVRIELWGDAIDTMAQFDVISQRRTDSLKSVEITPATEVLFESVDIFTKKLSALVDKTKEPKQKEMLKADLELLQSGCQLSSLDKYITLCYETSATLFDYMDNAILCVSEYQNIRERVRTFLWQQHEDQKQLLEDGILTRALINFEEDMPFLIRHFEKDLAFFMDSFGRSNPEMHFADLQTATFIQSGSFGGELKLLFEEIEPLIKENYSVVFMAGTKKAADSLAEGLNEKGIKAQHIKDSDEIEYGMVQVLSGKLSSGFEYPNSKISVMTSTREIQSKKRPERFKKGKHLKDIAELSVGDYIVHVEHGIGIFDGIHSVSMQNITKDYIKINFAGADVLYVPVTQLDTVSKYIGAGEDGKIKLNKLYSTEWQATKKRVSQAVSDMADELILLYSKRMETKGFAFSTDTEWQKDFEQRFPYVETDDQLRCVEEIKLDMERESPMDRVLCGDVGFGKTEVAMRACFKAVMDSKQVAVLCPTTILAWQHYQSFTKRFENFPINIEVISRFRTPKQQKEILKKLKAGLIDIIIGTHRLVQKDIAFKDLGLAIVDEEQRFGVKHKEHFKEMFTNVDMLTLSATPIPRTLNMAISGIRDMSTIEQAPSDRQPVQSYVLEYDKGIVMDAIRRELRRGGQCYYIHNRIESIEQTAAVISSEIPQARIAFAHGRMDEKELSAIWQQLVDREIDVLVCTTIIETGVDVANCNTLIIDNADHMGLSQLYQLRGRVGRSGRRAFAYFTFTKGKVLTEISAKRLAAIREFTKFGSGFHIAMRDLEIRGAGNILGGQQHGHMEAVGYDMYLRLLSEAIALRKGETLPEKAVECVIELQMDAHIPQTYIETTAARIDIYKKIAAITNEDDKFDVTDELLDRFGEPPQTVLALLDVALLRNILASHGFEKICEKPNCVLLYPQKLDMAITSKLIGAMPQRVMVNASAQPYITVKPKKGEKSIALDILKEIVTNLEGR